MKKLLFTMALMVCLTMSFSSCERVDAGHEGILVNLYGSDKGVNDVSLVTGMVWYKTLNNLFGLRNNDSTYMSFEHWTDAVAAYKKYIQKYESPPDDYYEYLDKLGYAEDKNYTTKLKQIIKK